MQNSKLDEFSKYVRGRKVAFLGIGVSNIPAMKYLARLGAIVTGFDKKSVAELGDVCLDLESLDINLVLGENNLESLVGFDLIFRSPSIRPDLEEIKREVKMGAILTSEIEMVMEMCPGKIIGITGSAGKTTTTTLIYEMLKEEGLDCYLGGNIGIPLFDKIEKMTEESIVVLELSSFQLMTMTKSPNIAVITNLAPDHLDIHTSLDEYYNAKKNIFKYQTANDVLVLNYDNKILRGYSKETKSQVRFFTDEEKLADGIMITEGIIKVSQNRVRKHVLETKDLLMVGEFNAKNLCSAMLATQDMVSLETMQKIARTFKGVEHRMEFVCEQNGVKYINNSIASSPIKAMSSLDEYNKDVIVIVGGSDKFVAFDDFAKKLLDKAAIVIINGATKDKIRRALDMEIINRKKNNIEVDTEIFEQDTFIEAVEKSISIAKPGQTVLLSPACASFDSFNNYKERGNLFKSIVKEKII